jgi:hypothetical protein
MERSTGQPEILAGLVSGAAHLITLQRAAGNRVAVKWLALISVRGRINPPPETEVVEGEGIGRVVTFKR